MMPQDEDRKDAGTPPADDLDTQVTDDIGAVQGTSPDEEDGDPVPPARAGEVEDKPAPDAGEIEWAGQVVKKPPHPG